MESSKSKDVRLTELQERINQLEKTVSKHIQETVSTTNAVVADNNNVPNEVPAILPTTYAPDMDMILEEATSLGKEEESEEEKEPEELEEGGSEGGEGSEDRGDSWRHPLPE